MPAVGTSCFSRSTILQACAKVPSRLLLCIQAGSAAVFTGTRSVIAWVTNDGWLVRFIRPCAVHPGRPCGGRGICRGRHHPRVAGFIHIGCPLAAAAGRDCTLALCPDALAQGAERAMTRSHRIAHRLIWLALGLLVALGFTLALTLRPPPDPPPPAVEQKP